MKVGTLLTDFRVIMVPGPQSGVKLHRAFTSRMPFYFTSMGLNEYKKTNIKKIEKMKVGTLLTDFHVIMVPGPQSGKK